MDVAWKLKTSQIKTQSATPLVHSSQTEWSEEFINLAWYKMRYSWQLFEIGEVKRPGAQAEQQGQIQEHSYELFAGISKYFKSQIQSTKEG